MNPDGTPRPAAQLVQRYAALLTADRAWPPSTLWFQFDRDAHAGGYWYACFNTGRDAYRKAVAQGGQLGIRTAGTGTDSANTPLVAVGNKPCSGHNPAKYLNAEFNFLKIQDASGKWIEVHNGDTVLVGEGVVRARISLGNTQEATWLAPQSALQPGDVLLAATPASQLRGQWPLPQSTSYLADADFGELELTRNVSQDLRSRAAHVRAPAMPVWRTAKFHPATR